MECGRDGVLTFLVSGCEYRGLIDWMISKVPETGNGSLNSLACWDGNRAGVTICGMM